MPDADATPTSDPDAPAPWYAEGLRFKCTQCGGCCTGGPGFVWFDEDEGAAMAKAKGLDTA